MEAITATPEATQLLVLLAGLLGLASGSFANVVIHRVPAGRSVVAPRSACPHCGTFIAARDNVPVASWLVLRGRCRSCGTAIPVRYPLVEALVAVVFAAVALRIGYAWSLPAYLLLAWLLVVVAAIDLETRRIPNRLTYALTPAIGVLLVAAAFIEGVPAAGGRALLGGAAGFAFLLVLALVSPRGMGMGDVKLAASIGIGLGYLGWAHVALGFFLAFLAGGLIGVVLIVTGLRDRRDQLPFGPYLALGALATILLGGPVIEAYTRLLV